jgi:hypothetical protein
MWTALTAVAIQRIAGTQLWQKEIYGQTAADQWTITTAKGESSKYDCIC